MPSPPILLSFHFKTPLRSVQISLLPPLKMWLSRSLLGCGRLGSPARHERPRSAHRHHLRLHSTHICSNVRHGLQGSRWQLPGRRLNALRCENIRVIYKSYMYPLWLSRVSSFHIRVVSYYQYFWLTAIIAENTLPFWKLIYLLHTKFSIKPDTMSQNE